MRMPRFRLRGPARARLRLRIRRPAFDLRKAMFILPNLFTAASILCGFYGAVTAAGVDGQPATHDAMMRACVAILCAAFFDGIDGRVARMTHTQSAFGVQMDSLADVVSFGAAPALIAWHWGLWRWGSVGLLACFFFCACGAIRLARFNVLASRAQGPSHFFVGLPIPAAAWIVVAIIIAWLDALAPALTGTEPWPPIMMVALGIFMVSTIPFRTFKSGRMSRKALAALFAVLGATAFVAIEVRPSFAVVALMGAYLVYGLGEWLYKAVRKMSAPAAPGDNVGGREDKRGD